VLDVEDWAEIRQAQRADGWLSGFPRDSGHEGADLFWPAGWPGGQGAGSWPGSKTGSWCPTGLAQLAERSTPPAARQRHRLPNGYRRPHQATGLAAGTGPRPHTTKL